MSGRPAVRPSKLSDEDRDDAWAVRAILTRPNWAIIQLILQKGSLTARKIYSELGTEFTRKTLIGSLQTLSLETHALLPKHVKGKTGFEISYDLNPSILAFAEEIKRVQKAVTKKE